MTDPVPPELRERVLALFDRHEPGVAVVDLTRDSLLDDEQPSPHRRTLEFRGNGYEVDVLLELVDGEAVALLEVRPPADYDVTARTEEALLVAGTDPEGRCRLSAFPQGLASFLLERVDRSSPPVRTAWLRY